MRLHELMDFISFIKKPLSEIVIGFVPVNILGARLFDQAIKLLHIKLKISNLFALEECRYNTVEKTSKLIRV